MSKSDSAQKATAGSFEQMGGKSNDLDKLVASAIAGQAPGEINEPTPGNGDKEGDSKTTWGITYKNYQYFWKFTCAFTKWVPTNQFMYAEDTVYDPTKMTLERFGFIGMDKRCFWGMVGVKWLQPLKIHQILPQ